VHSGKVLDRVFKIFPNFFISTGLSKVKGAAFERIEHKLYPGGGLA
jgi:hypothetical protein